MHICQSFAISMYSLPDKFLSPVSVRSVHRRSECIASACSTAGPGSIPVLPLKIPLLSGSVDDIESDHDERYFVFQMRKIEIKKGDKRPPNLQDSVHFTIIGLLFVCCSWIKLQYCCLHMYDAPGMLYPQLCTFSQSKLSPFINYF